MPSCTQWNPLKMEGNMRVLLLDLPLESGEGGMGTSRGAGCFWTVAEDIHEATVRLDGNCLVAYRPSSTSSSSGTTTSSSSSGSRNCTDLVAGMVTLSGDTVLHQLLLLLWHEEEKGAGGATQLLCSRFGRRSHGDGKLPNGEQLGDLISSHLLALVGNDGGSGIASPILPKSPEWFLCVFGDCRLPFTDVAAANLQQRQGQQEQQGMVLWFRNDPSFVACEFPAPETTALFSEWWRILQRSVLLPMAEIAVDLLLLSHEQPSDSVSDTPAPGEGCSGAFHKESSRQHVANYHGLPTGVASIRCLTRDDDHDDNTESNDDDDTKSDFLSRLLGRSTGVDDFSFQQGRQPMMDLRSSSIYNPPTLPSSSSSSSSSQKKQAEEEEEEKEERVLSNLGEAQCDGYRGLTKTLPRLQLQLETILQHAAHIVLLVLANGDTMAYPDAAELPASNATPTVWYVQLVVQYSEAYGVLTCGLGGTPKVRLTLSAHSASRFVLLPMREPSKVREGWRLHSVDHPGVAMQLVGSSTVGWTLAPVMLREVLPLVSLSLVPTSAASSSVRCSVIGETSVFSLDDGQHGQPGQARQPYLRLHVAPPCAEDAELQVVADCKLHTLIATPPTMHHTDSLLLLLPVYVAIAPAWRDQAAPRFPSPFSHLQGSLMRRWRHRVSPRWLDELSSKGACCDATSSSALFGDAGRVVPHDFSREKAAFGDGVSEESAAAAAAGWYCTLFSGVTASLRVAPLQIVLVGSSGVGKTMMTRWLWARSRGWSDADMLHELDKWFWRDASFGTVTEEGCEEDVVTTLLQTTTQPPPPPQGQQQSPRLLLSEEKGYGNVGVSDGQNAAQRVVLTVGGKAHVFVGADAQFLMQSVAGVSEVLLHVVDQGVPTNVQIIDIHGFASRELLRSHCERADVVICAIDTRDFFSLAWLEERLDVLTSGFTGRFRRETGDPCEQQQQQEEEDEDHHCHPHQQFVLLKVNEGSPHQVVYSREIQRVLQKADAILGAKAASWVVWDVPCEEQLEKPRRCELLYQHFLDLVQRRHVSRLVSSAMGWDSALVLRLQRVAHVVEGAREDCDGGWYDTSCRVKEDLARLLHREISCFPVTLCERVLRESSQRVVVGPSTTSLPLWCRLLRWLMTGFCISDPLAHCFWLALRVLEEDDDNNNNSNNKGSRMYARDRYSADCKYREDVHVESPLTRWGHSVTVPKLQSLLEAFYHFKMRLLPASAGSFTCTTLVLQEVARLVLVDVSLATLKIWMGRVVDAMQMTFDDYDSEGGTISGCQTFLSFMFSHMLGDSAAQASVEKRKGVGDVSITETLVMSVTVLRMLHDSSGIRDTMRCVAEPSGALSMSCSVRSMMGMTEAQPNEESGVDVLAERRTAPGVAGMSRNCDDWMQRPAHSSTRPRPAGGGGGGGGGGAEKEKKGVGGELLVAEFAHSLRRVWPTADVAYELDWRITWTPEDEAQFIRNVHLEIERHEEVECSQHEPLGSDETLECLALPTRSYVVMEPGSADDEAKLEALYRDAAEDLAPL